MVGGGARSAPDRRALLATLAARTRRLTGPRAGDLQRRHDDLLAFSRLAVELQHAPDSATVARTVLASLVQTHGFACGALLGGPEGQLALLASAGRSVSRTGRPGRSETVDRAQAAGAALRCTPTAEQEPWLRAVLPGTGPLVVVPLNVTGDPVGAVLLESGPELDPRLVAALERVASYAALALRSAWTLEQVQRLAATDGLTKIANRRTFEATLEREIARATRSSESVSLVMLDIDHFKQLNDTHGHRAGDEVLRNVAAAIAIECRDFDTPARYGGEEFAVVLPGCGPQEAFGIADRLRNAVSSAPSVVPVTASAGVATYPGHAGDADTLVRAADEALYASKRGGRDRTTAAAHAPAAQVEALLRRAISERVGVADATAGTDGPARRTSG